MQPDYRDQDPQPQQTPQPPTPLATLEQTPVASYTPITPQQPVANSRSKRRLVWGILLAALVISILISGTFFTLHRHHTKYATRNDSARAATGTSSAKIDTSSLASAYDSIAASGVQSFSPDKKSATIQAFSSLTDGFALDSAFYNDSTSVLIALGLARGSLEHTDQHDGYRNALYLLATNYLSGVPQGIVDEYYVPPKTIDSTTPSILAKYTDQSTTALLKSTLQTSGIEADVAKNLGLGGTTVLATYTPVVLNFDQGTSQQTQFGKEHYMFGASPNMWVESTSTTRYVVMTHNYATGFINDTHGYERNVVTHELVHSQQSFVRGELGHTIEERRAELFSGDHSAYYDAKQLCIYLGVFGGYDPLDTLKAHPTDSASFYSNLYNNLGLDGANAVITSTPGAFLTQPSTAVQKVQKTFGGMDGAIKVALEIGAHNQSAMNSRMQARYDRLQSVLGTKQKVLQDLSDNLDRTYNMPSAANAMKAYINR